MNKCISLYVLVIKFKYKMIDVRSVICSFKHYDLGYFKIVL